MTRLAIIFSMLFATLAWAGEVDGNSFLTARAECIDSQTSLTAKTEIVSKHFDAELSENFYPDFFVKSIDERKFELCIWPYKLHINHFGLYLGKWHSVLFWSRNNSLVDRNKI